jgi:hypothetical protein
MLTESTEMRFLRPAAGHTLLDHKLNTLKPSKLKILNKTERIQREKIKLIRTCLKNENRWAFKGITKL